MISPRTLLMAALCCVYVFQLLLLGNFYRYFWRTYQNEQNWLSFLVLLTATVFWPVVTPIAYVRSLEVKSASVACLRLKEVDVLREVDVSVAYQGQTQ